MSVAAVKWAYLQDIDRSTTKFILVTLANLVRHDDELWEVYASVEFLAQATSQNRKTVLESLKRLREAGYIRDTGRTAGGNGCVPIYLLAADNGAGQAASGSVNAAPPARAAAAADAGNASTAASLVQCNAGAAPKALPRAWVLPAAWRAWTRKHKPLWDDARIEAVAAIFYAHFTSGASGRPQTEDWFAAWRQWVFKGSDSTPEQTLEPNGQDTQDLAALGAQVREAMARLNSGPNALGTESPGRGH